MRRRSEITTATAWHDAECRIANIELGTRTTFDLRYSAFDIPGVAPATRPAKESTVSATQTIARERHHQILEGAARGEQQLVLTHNSNDGWRTYKAVFASGQAPAKGILVKVTSTENGAERKPPEPGDVLGATFRIGHKKCMFSTVLVSIQGKTEDSLWTIRRPEQLQQLQRRAYERAAPPLGTVIAVRFWREVAGDNAVVDTRNVRHGQLEDISAGGMRIKVADSKDVQLDRTYRCAFTLRPGKPSLVLDAVLRHREAADQGRSSLGFQFVGMETTQDGLHLLDRLVRVVNHFQRSYSRESNAY